MSNYVVFRDLSSQSEICISKRSLDYPDYLSLSEGGYYKVVKEGSKKECTEFLDLETSKLEEV